MILVGKEPVKELLVAELMVPVNVVEIVIV